MQPAALRACMFAPRSAYQGFGQITAISAGESASAHDLRRKATGGFPIRSLLLSFVVLSLLASSTDIKNFGATQLNSVNQKRQTDVPLRI